MPDLKLTAYDRNVLLNPVGWITDSIVDAAQTLLKQQFPHIRSLQNVTKGMTMSFYIQTGAFVQILHSDGHWFTVSSSGGSIPTVKVFDSMYSTVPTLGKAQIACLLCTQEEMIQVEVMDVQQQVCGKQAATYYKMSIIICRWVAMTVDSLPLLLPQQRHMEELQIYANLNKLKCDDIFTPVFLLEN